MLPALGILRAVIVEGRAARPARSHRAGGTGVARRPLGRGPPGPPRGGIRHALRAFRHRDFAVFWAGAVVSNTGNWIQNLTVPYVLYQLTGSAFWVGFAAFSQFMPVMVLGPLAGSIADRFDRRRVLLATQSAMAVVAFALWAAWASGVRSLTVILLLVGASGLVTGLNSELAGFRERSRSPS